ncbi:MULTISPECIES: hypothetical protein [unclassified Pseudomonas]|uniref:hypothetical protein n=1 Tax=unclassified Pseudomonas TaxID=196821 RepID=UPI0030D96637
MKKWIRNLIVAAVAGTFSILIFPALLSKFNKDSEASSSAFKEHYVLLTKKGTECLALDQKLQQQSVQLAGSMILARKELNRMVQADFNIGPDYEPIIKTVLQNFSATQDTHSQTLASTNNCWADLKSLMEETSVAAGVYEKYKAADPELVLEENKINMAERTLRTQYLDPIDAEALYENLVKMSSTHDTQKLRQLIGSFDKGFESLISFRQGMIDVTTQRVQLRSKFYNLKKDFLAKALSASN